MTEDFMYLNTTKEVKRKMSEMAFTRMQKLATATKLPTTCIISVCICVLCIGDDAAIPGHKASICTIFCHVLLPIENM